MGALPAAGTSPAGPLGPAGTNTDWSTQNMSEEPPTPASLSWSEIETELKSIETRMGKPYLDQDAAIELLKRTFALARERLRRIESGDCPQAEIIRFRFP